MTGPVARLEAGRSSHSPRRSGSRYPRAWSDSPPTAATPDETPPRNVWPAVNHFATAHLRSVWGIYGEPAGLDAIDGFDGLTIEEQHVVG